MGHKNLLKGTVLAAALAGLLTVSAAAAEMIGVGTVQGDGLRLRSGAGLEHSVLTSANTGDTVMVMGEQGGWYKVDFGTQVGYMSAGFVSVSTSVDANLGLGMVTAGGSTLNLRAQAGTSAQILASMPDGTAVELTGFENGWYKLTYNGVAGYASSEYITPVLDANGARRDTPVQVNKPGALGQKIVDEAMKHVGKSYVYGAKGPNAFDCSGFVYYCVKQASGGSIVLPGGSVNQWLTAPGQRIYSINELQTGDIFFICDPKYSGGKIISHVAIYAGNGNMIHASDRRTGVIFNPLRNKDYRYFVGGIRLG